MAGTLTVSGLSSGELAGERIFGPLTMVGKAVIGETLVIPLTVGDNTIAVPLESIAVMMIRPLGGTATVKVRTNLNSTDGGLLLPEEPFPFVYPFPNAIPTSIILNAASIVASISITFI